MPCARGCCESKGNEHASATIEVSPRSVNCRGRGRHLTGGIDMSERICSVEDCRKPTGVAGTARGWCTKHYQRWQRYGDPLTITNPRNLSPRKKFDFWTQKTEDCWLWTGSASTSGYGTLTVDGHRRPAHRFSYEIHIGPIPDGHEIHHTCQVPACVNPAHLVPLTHRRHLRLHADQVTHCPQGHGYTPENTWTYRGSRYCRECRRTEARERKRRLRAAAS